MEFKWPQGKKLAVWIVMNIEHFEFGKLGPALQPHLNSYPEIANYSWRDYGNRVGIYRLFELFSKLQLPVSAAINAEMGLMYPDICSQIKKMNWELLGHGWNNSTGHSGLEPVIEKELILKTMNRYVETFGLKPLGWLSPGFSVTENTYKFLTEQGIQYTADWVGDDLPFWYNQLMALPYSYETNDISLLLSGQQTGPEYFQSITDHARQLLSESGCKMMTLGLHPFLVGQPNKLKYLQQTLQYLMAESDIWFASGNEIYNWCKTQINKN